MAVKTSDISPITTSLCPACKQKNGLQTEAGYVTIECGCGQDQIDYSANLTQAYGLPLRKGGKYQGIDLYSPVPVYWWNSRLK